MHWPACYEFLIAEPLENHWLEWFRDLDIHPVVDQSRPGTLLRGELRDPAALFGLLARIRDLNLTLLEIRRLEEN